MTDFSSKDLEKLEIPEFTPLSCILDCDNCSMNESCKYYDYKENLSSKYDCIKLHRKHENILFIIELIIFSVFSVFSLNSYEGFGMSLLVLVITFICIIAIDCIANYFLHRYFLKSELKRKQAYADEVEKIKAENESIRKAKLGITQELEDFLSHSSLLLDSFSRILNELNESEKLISKEGKRFLTKLQAVISELEKLNSKISKDNFEITYINTLYNLHLPKLLEYLQKFLELLNSNSLTEQQVIEFANLLEVFRTKLAGHATYMEQQVGDDFLIKVQALNKTVLPDFDGSEEIQDE